jgi:hypothetical protein
MGISPLKKELICKVNNSVGEFVQELDNPL